MNDGRLVMAFVVADPELMTSAASDLAGIGSNVSAAHIVAAARTTSVIPAAADEVSTGIAHLFSQHAQDYQALAGQASEFHDQFVQHLTASAASYATTEAANVASLLRPLTALEGLVSNAIATGVQGLIRSVLADLSYGVVETFTSLSALGPPFNLIAVPLFFATVIAFFLLLAIGLTASVLLGNAYQLVYPLLAIL